MKRAILSDIHSNLDALQAVLKDIEQQQADAVYCLGDVVGYGPNPRECIDLVMTMDHCVLGNHDQGALFDPEGFSSGAERAIFWTRQQLEEPPCGEGLESDAARESRAKRWNFLSRLPRTIREGDTLFVHGSPRNPLSEYVFPEDAQNPRKMDRIFSMIPRLCFQGHTHVPGIFPQDGRFCRPDQLGSPLRGAAEMPAGYRLGPEKVMINVGSVGQPRDGDPRSCYVLWEGDTIYFRRVAYPVQNTVAKIHAIPALDRFLGDRLLEGR